MARDLADHRVYGTRSWKQGIEANMARSDLLLSLVQAANQGDRTLLRKSVEALVAEERAKQHHVLADQLAAKLREAEPVRRVEFAREGAADLFWERTPRRTLGSLILPAAVEAACQEIVEEQLRTDLLRSYGLEPRHRVLLVGPPGNGKTSVAEALAEALSLPLLVVRYEALVGSYLGETAARMGRLFEHARSRRCVLFFDEFESLGKERGDQQETGEIKRVVSSLLLQIDALPSHVVVVTATNHPELLDRAVWRRFQLRLDLPQPTSSQIKAFLARFEARTEESLGAVLSAAAKALEGSSFSELEEFTTDLLRRRALGPPGAGMRPLFAERLALLRASRSEVLRKKGTAHVRKTRAAAGQKRRGAKRQG